jgi:hypothetical protein
MKYLIFIITFFSVTTRLFSQDSINVRTEIDTFKQSNYEGQFDYVFSRKEPQKQLFKSGILNALSGGHSEMFSYERKIGEDISLHFSLNMLKSLGLSTDRILGRDITDSTTYESEPRLGFSFEPRWYFNMKRDIKNGLNANNFHGSYLGLRTSFEIETSPINNVRSNSDSTSFFSTPQNDYNHYISNELCFGIQRRILKYQYIDFGISTGIRTRIRTEIPTEQRQTQWIFNYRLAYGFLLNGSSKGKNNAAKCDALRCFEEEHSMLKIGLSNLINQLNERRFTGILSIAYEQKIPKTQFSIESSISIGGNLHTKSDTKVSKFENKYGFIIGVMPRYYYDLKKRIAKGESADNLSGGYFGVKFDYSQAKWYSNLKEQSVGTTFLYGSQQRILQHLGFDWWVGYGTLWNKANTESFSWGVFSANLSLNLAF